MNLSIIERAIAIQLFSHAVSKPIPVNEPDAKPDYEAIAKECHARAKETAPFLMKELSNE
jgi:hypothetical protein